MALATSRHVIRRFAAVSSYAGGMKAKSTITVRLEPAERERLAAEAERQGVAADQLVHELIRAALARLPEDAEERRRRGLEALKRLRELTKDLPPIDGVAVARQAREELEQRPFQ